MIERRAKRKGQAMVISPALTTAYPYGSGRGHAVLKITFAELLRSGSRVRNSLWQADLRAPAEPSDLPISKERDNYRRIVEVVAVK